MTILTINSGSSSLKFALFDAASEREILVGSIDRIGLSGGSLHAKVGGREIAGERQDFPDHDSALGRLLTLVGQHGGEEVGIVGHRLVYGGQAYQEPQAVTPELTAALRKLIPFATEHLPHELKAIEAVGRATPERKQYVCFDTAFHSRKPEIAKQYPIPRDLWSEGVIRYGFHGLSYAYILEELAKEAPEAVNGRIVIAHLGNGASMAAVHQGRPIDTTMGFTPAGGLMMGARSGDLDPGVLLYLQEQKQQSAQQIRDLVNRRSGLLGVSGTTSDMQDLMAKESTDARAAEAIALYCYQAKKHLGALIAVLGGIETLIFTAGIGENAPEIRARICDNLQCLGIHLNSEENARNSPIVSNGQVTVRVMKTDEDRMIARQAGRFLV